MTQKVFFAHRAISGRGGGFGVKLQCKVPMSNGIDKYHYIISINNGPLSI